MIEGNSRRRDKNLRNWLVNEACEIGANAVVEVVVSERDDPRGRIRFISGMAVVYTSDSAAMSNASPAR
jgi:hypothetical protein